jgi:predicted DNA-binding transcriptional regulator YafY
MRAAMRKRLVAELEYKDAEGKPSARRVRPLGLYFWGDAWSLAAWCELRQDFRNFRLDRIVNVRTLDETFLDEPGKRLEDFVRRMQEDH